MPSISSLRSPAKRPPSKMARRTCSRRQFLKAGAGGVGLAAATASAATGRRTRRLLKPSAIPRLVRAEDLDPTLVTLLDRTSFGFSLESYDEAASMGYDAYLESQLDYEFIDDSEMDALLAPFDTLSMTSKEIVGTYGMMQGVPAGQLIEATILRAALSRRQLHERMVQFWTDHFNIDIQDGPVVFLKTADDRDVIRQHAMTTFPELLNASARSAAMLHYLDNYENIAGHAQENYARELMELHSVGADGGYTQQDVEEVARCLTGWGYVRRDGSNDEFGAFAFFSARHDFEEKTVLGQLIPAGGGESDGQTVLDILANHPSAARFIARKLCARFLGYQPPEDVVNSVRETYLRTGGDIKSMLRVIFQVPVMTYMTTPKFKRPFHYVVSLLRASAAQVFSGRFIGELINIMGQAPFIWPTPDGYPDRLDAWANALLQRWDFSSLLFDRQVPGVLASAQDLLDAQGDIAAGEEAAAINRILTGGRLTAEETALIQQFYDDGSSSDTGHVRDTFGLAASLPGFQWY